jgi:hypothetical protein
MSSTLLRETCQRGGDELDEIEFLLGEVSIQNDRTQPRCKQVLRFAVNDRKGHRLLDAAYSGNAET